MCGRFTLKASAHELQEAFPLFELPALAPRYNVAPTQSVLAVRQETADVKPHGVLLRWGLVPFWASDTTIGTRLINARGDTVRDKPAFRSAFKKRRCLVLSDGFYEWQQAAKKGAKKQPYHIRRPDQKPFAFAGLWERWDKEGEPVETCTIITTDANAPLRSLHDRMPVILDAKDYARWLDPGPVDPERLLELLVPAPDDALVAVPVNPHVNNARHDDPACLEPVSVPGTLY
jgi:putative SOS response-associated peptidase YedK